MIDKEKLRNRLLDEKDKAKALKKANYENQDGRVWNGGKEWAYEEAVRIVDDMKPARNWRAWFIFMVIVVIVVIVVSVILLVGI